VLCGLVRQHEHQLILSRWFWPNDNEIAQPIGERLPVLSIIAAQLLKRVCFHTAGATLGCEAFQFVVWDQLHHSLIR
jgi:hypothetical protein